MNWALTILALVCYSLLGLTLKSAAIRKNNPARLIWVALIVVSVASLGAFLLGSQRNWGWQGVALGLASGVFFYLASVERVKALQSTPAGVVFAVTNLDLVISSVLAALLPFLADTLNLQKVVAAALAAVAIFLVSWTRDHRQQVAVSPHTYVSLGLLVISAMGYTIYSARLAYPVFLFMFFDHLAGVLLNARDIRNVKRVEIGWGFAAGALMFVGLWSLMTALQTSVISLTLITVSLNTVAVALLSWLFLKERLTVYQVVALFVAVAASIVVVLG